MKKLGAWIAAIAMTAAGSLAFAQYPTKPIRVLVPFGVGSSTDIVMRILAQPLGQALGQSVVIDNKPGADGVVAAVELVRHPADGHTLFLATNSPLSAAPHLRKKVPYEALKDFTAISLVGNYTFFVVVHPRLPVKTLPELITLVRKNPGKLNYASGNTSSIVMTAMLAALAKLDMTHIPYKTEPPAIVDLLSGQVQLMISSYSTVAPHVESGKLRALVTTLPMRSPLLPQVPTIVEAGMPEFPIVPWAGMFGPAKMPRNVTERLNKELVGLIDRPEVRDQLNKQAFLGRSSGIDELTTFVRNQYDIWGKAIRDAGIQPD
ncbi:MAG: tripartite tricarboxylate transporter substrate binding protein [Burkholderiales bacterium]|nr:tripartite tricarboxylate transporter substrate binding protein [Burkholderiales bacterium]